MFCTSFCRACCRIQEEQINREAQRRREQGSTLRSIYFIPFPRSVSRQDNADSPAPPQYNNSAYHESPPSYNEVKYGFIKLDNRILLMSTFCIIPQLCWDWNCTLIFWKVLILCFLSYAFCSFQLGIKPDDLPPPYTENSLPEYSATCPPTHINTVPTQDSCQP